MHALIRPLRVISPLLLCVAASAAAQAPNIKPGLWEMKMQDVQGPNMAGAQKVDMQKAMKDMQAHMAKMPAEQRRMMEQQMEQMGVSLQADTMAMRVCMTEQDIREQEIPMGDDNCDTKVTTRSATRWVATTSCTEPKMSGVAEAVFSSPTTYSVSVKGTVTEAGRTQPYSMKMNWKHVSSDCGKVKSLSAMNAAAGNPPAAKKPK